MKHKVWMCRGISFIIILGMLLQTVSVHGATIEPYHYLRHVEFAPTAAVTEPVETDGETMEAVREPENYYSEEFPEGEPVAFDEHAVTFEKEDGTFITQVGGTALTFEDEQGNTCLVDNTLVEQKPLLEEDYYENAANDYQIQLPVELSTEQGITLTKDSYTLRMRPIEGDFSQGISEENVLRYNNIFPGIDYQYTVLGDTIKEDIIVNYPTEQTSFSYALEGEGLYFICEDGIILAYGKNEELIFSILAPEMTDGAGEVSQGVVLTLEEQEGSYYAHVQVDEQWLQQPERVYPVRIDPSITITDDTIGLYGVEEMSANMVIGDNNYPYCGYDNGILSNNWNQYGNFHGICRTYAQINYDFSQIPTEAKIDSASFGLYHYTSWSNGGTTFGLYTADSSWEPGSLTWNSQSTMSHTAIGYENANGDPGYIYWDVTGVINNWVQELQPNYGFVVKAENENNAQCEVFYNKNGVYKPTLIIEWSIPDPVDINYPLDATTVNLRPMNQKDVSGLLHFDGVFADGTAKPEAMVVYQLLPNSERKETQAGFSYRYPDNTGILEQFPNSTPYLDKQSNWQTGLFTNLSYDTRYQVTAQASLNDTTGAQVSSDSFVIYQVKRLDTLPSIARYYNVPLNTLVQDNRVQDTLAVENNTLFIRNPSTEAPYNPGEQTDDEKQRIDSALMGRGLHCEFGFEPINLNTGNFLLEAEDLSIPDLNGTFSIQRTYNSKGSSRSSMFGRKWSFAWEEQLSLLSDGTVIYQTGEGANRYFTPMGDGSYLAPAGYNYTLRKIANPLGETVTYTYILESQDGTIREFNCWGLLSAVTDPQGNRTVLVYDENGCLTSITSPSGKAFHIQCDAQGRITKITLPNQGTLQYTYDTVGNLIAYTNAEGDVIRYEYDSNYNMTAWYDGNGTRMIQNQYDAQERVVVQYDGNNQKITLSYQDGKTTTIDGNGNKTEYYYDNQYRTTKICYADGSVDTFTYTPDNRLKSDSEYSYKYDTNGNQIAQIREDGQERRYVYDGKHHLTGFTDYDGTTTTYAYNAAGKLTGIRYADGNTKRYVYDAFQRLVASIDENGNQEIYAYSGKQPVPYRYTDKNGNQYALYYNAMNQLVSVQAPNGSVYRYVYDKAGRLIGEQAADGGYTEYQLDGAGNTVLIVDPMGYGTKAQFDGNYNLLCVTDALSHVLEYTYDGNGNITKMVYDGKLLATYTYDSRNRMTSYVDGDGGNHIYTYDAEGNIISYQNPLGEVTTYTYDATRNLPIQEKDPLGRITLYEYDELGNLTEILYEDGTKETYVYDSRMRLASYTDRTELTTIYQYDPTGNLLEAIIHDEKHYNYTYDKNGNQTGCTEPEGNTWTYTYDNVNRLIQVAAANGGITQYVYDEAGRVTEAIDPLNRSISYGYDLNGNQLWQMDGEGAKTEYRYDALGQLVSVINACGEVTNYEYDALGQVISTTDPTGYQTKYEYSTEGRVIQITDANGATMQMQYDANGNLTQIASPEGRTASFTYDAGNQLIQTVDGAGYAVTYEYDNMGNLLSELDSNGYENTYAYDSYGRLASVTDALGRKAEYEYDAYSQLTTYIDVDGTKEQYAYTANGYLASIIDAGGQTTVYAYDALGNLTEQTTGERIYQYTYDKAGQLIAETDPMGYKTAYTYDNRGLLLTTTDANGGLATYGYDAVGRLISTQDANGGLTTYTYDPASRLSAYTTPEQNTTEFRYDGVGNIIKAKDANGYITEYTYDAFGNLTESLTQRGAKTTYTYDAHNQLTGETDAEGNQTTYEVDDYGNITKITEANGNEYQYTYDAVGRITGIKTPKGLARSFAYDQQGNLSSETDNLGRTTTYQYDELHNLTQIVNPAGMITSYTYDDFGNLTSVRENDIVTAAFLYDKKNQITSVTNSLGEVTTYEYDGLGNRTETISAGNRRYQYEYDKNSNLVTVVDPMEGKTLLTYNQDNLPIAVTNPLGMTQAYRYDGMGQVIETGLLSQTATNELTTLEQETDASLNYSTKYTYDAHGNTIRKQDATGSITSYEYDMSDRLTGVADGLGQETTYTYDSVGNLISTTNTAGQEIIYTYDEAGNLTGIQSPDASLEQMEYDLANNLVASIRPDGTKVQYEYDELNRLVSESYQDGTQVIYTYDNAGNVSSMEDTLGTASYEYDSEHRLVSVTDSLNQTVTYTYDEAGNLASLTYADGKQVTYEYDKNNRLITVTDSQGKTTYTYDAAGRIIQATYPNQTQTRYLYEGSALATVINENTDGTPISIFQYDYDQNGNIISEQAQQEETNITRTYTYDAIGQLLTCREEIDGAVVEYCYEYDAVGNRTRMEEISSEGTETIDYTYDVNNRLVQESSSTEGITTYTYDANGYLIEEQQEGKAVKEYTYDVAQRLTAIREGGDLIMAAGYDGNGNRLFQVNRIHTKQEVIIEEGKEIEDRNNPEDTTEDKENVSENIQDNEIGTDSTETDKISLLDIFFYGMVQGWNNTISTLNPSLMPALNRNWNRTWNGWHSEETSSETIGTQEQEDTTGDSRTDTITSRIETNLQNQGGLTEAETGAILGTDSTWEDLLTFRIEEVVNTEYALTCYVNDINREYTEVLTEYTVSGSKTDNIFSSITGTEEIQVLTDYVYGNQRIYGTGETTAYYLYDGTGSVTEQVNQRADLLNTYRYDPYGTLTSGNVEESNYYGYRGEETNPITGMQYLRYRYYDTAAGRFQTPDSYLGSLIQPISQNRYEYTGNNPVMYGDKSGHMPQLIAGMLIGGVIGGMVGGVIGLNAGWISGAIESYQRQKATGSVNYGIVFRDSVIGGISGGIGGFVGGAIEGALTVAAPSPLSQVPISAFSNTVDGAITRYTESLLYNWFTNEPHVNPVSNALDPTSLAVDVVIGGAGGLVGFGTDKIAGKVIKNLPAEKAIADFIYGRQDTCFSQGADTISDMTAEPVEDGAKKVKDFIDNIFGKKNDIDETAEAVGKNSDVTDAGTAGGHDLIQAGYGNSINISEQKMYQLGNHFNKHGRTMGYISKSDYDAGARQFFEEHIDDAEIFEGIWNNSRGQQSGELQIIIRADGKQLIINKKSGQIIDFYEGTSLDGFISVERVQ